MGPLPSQTSLDMTDCSTEVRNESSIGRSAAGGSSPSAEAARHVATVSGMRTGGARDGSKLRRIPARSRYGGSGTTSGTSTSATTPGSPVSGAQNSGEYGSEEMAGSGGARTS